MYKLNMLSLLSAATASSKMISCCQNVCINQAYVVSEGIGKGGGCNKTVSLV